MKSHDLDDYMHEVTSRMDAEYKRIRKNARNDPGTAGDEGEENWAELLRDWLPPTYHIVTKGQILSLDGSLSPQVDILVLHPNYPRHLQNKKKYLEGGVLAAFECKLTLNKQHIYAAINTSAKIRRQVPNEEGTPYRELHSPIIYGLLAHSHSWKDSGSRSADIISEHLSKADETVITHPREMLDFVCVSDLATWTVAKDAVTNPDAFLDWSEIDYGPAGSPSTTYFCNSKLDNDQTPEFTPIGIFIAQLLVRLAWKDSTLRNLASYFAEVEYPSSSEGRFRMWSKDIFSSEVRRKMKTKKMPDDEIWNEWSQCFG